MNEFKHHKSEVELRVFVSKWANRIWNSRHTLGIDVDSVEQLSDLLYELEMDKARQNNLTDALQEYNDEIVSIVELEEEDTMDITVSADNLFYANGILTKNSIGLPQTLDFFMAQTTDDIMMENGKQLWHLLKTRWGNKSNVKPQLVNCDFNHMRFSDIDEHTEHVKEVQSKVGQNKPQKKDTSAIDFD